MDPKRWPRRRLHLRAIVSTAMVLGWVLAALSGLLPYYFAGSGPGSSSSAVLGVTRSVWMSLHLWSSIGMVVFTVIHVVLNRKGVTRAVKVVAGADLRKRVGPVTAAEQARPRRRRGYAWVAVIASVAVLTIGGVVFAADHGPGRSRDRAVAEIQDDGLPSRFEDTTLPDATNLVIGDESPDDQSTGRRGRR